MIYAVIADIHGNYPAFRAVIEDARTMGAEAYLLLGDYLRDTPFLNDVADTIRSLPNLTAILGNGDIRIISLDKTRPEVCDHEQMLPNFWTYKNLSRENMEFLKSLPESADVITPFGRLHLSHSISLIGHSPRLGIFHSGDYARRMERTPFTMRDGMRSMQRAAEEYAHEVAGYPGDICLFGHNHLQFLGRVSGKTLLNPGSCGMPGDYDTRAPYAIIDGEISLRRVAYDIDRTIDAVRGFTPYPHAGFWGRLYISHLRSASDLTVSRFWEHARRTGGGSFPMDNDAWRRAVSTYEFK
jgi:predicted phosphodiesterase